MTKETTTPDPEKTTFFAEAGRGKALLNIVNLARFNPGIIILTGDEGSGRSLLLQKLSARVNTKPGLLAIIDKVVKTKYDLYRAIAESFAVELVEGETIDALEERVLEFLQGSFVTCRPVVLAVDNIQQFSLSMLEELIKLLRRYKKISLLLVGDNNLSAMLKHLDTGKTVRHEVALKPLTRGEMRQYTNWRIAFTIDDHEFDDIVNTTKGNFALLEREAQKKELAYQARQANKDNRSFRSLHFSKRTWLLAFVLIVVVSAIGLYFTRMNEIPAALTAQPASAPTTESAQAPAAVTAAAISPDDTSKNILVDHQMELLMAAPDNIKPETSVPVPEPVKTLAEVEKPQPAAAPVVREVVVHEVVHEVVPDVAVDVKRVVKHEVKPVIPAQSGEDDSTKLLAMPPQHYSIQLLGAQSKKTIDQFLAAYQGENKLYYFRSEKDGKDWYVVMCGEYANRQAAIQAAAELPAELKKNAPWPRRLSEVHALINSAR